MRQRCSKSFNRPNAAPNFSQPGLVIESFELAALLGLELRNNGLEAASSPLFLTGWTEAATVNATVEL